MSSWKWKTIARKISRDWTRWRTWSIEWSQITVQCLILRMIKAIKRNCIGWMRWTGRRKRISRTSWQDILNRTWKRVLFFYVGGVLLSRVTDDNWKEKNTIHSIICFNVTSNNRPTNRGVFIPRTMHGSRTIHSNYYLLIYSRDNQNKSTWKWYIKPNRPTKRNKGDGDDTLNSRCFMNYWSVDTNPMNKHRKDTRRKTNGNHRNTSRRNSVLFDKDLQ